MAYINFKEEKVKNKKQLKKRKDNNENLYNYILKHKDSLKGYFADKTYSYNKVVDKFIGKKGILDEESFYIIEYEDIICSKFIGCTFNNIKFKDCRFIGCTFEECNFSGGGVVFENCIFIKEDSETMPSLNRKDNLGCSFYKCDMYCKFLNCDISFSIFEECKIENTNFELTFAQNTIALNSEFDKVEVSDCNFCGFKTIECYLLDFSFNDNDKTKFDEKTFFDKINPRIKNKQEYEGIYMTYKTLADKFKENTLNNNFGEYYYLAQCTESKCIGILPKLVYKLNWFTCGFGERPWNCIVSSLIIILVFSIIYLFSGLDLEGEIIKYSIYNMDTWSIKKFIQDFNESFHISVGMFGGIGVDNAKPIQTTYIFANIEILIGIVMMGIGIGTLTRKIVR